MSNKIKNSVYCWHWLHFKCPVGTNGWRTAYGTTQMKNKLITVENFTGWYIYKDSHHLKKFLHRKLLFTKTTKNKESHYSDLYNTAITFFKYKKMKGYDICLLTTHTSFKIKKKKKWGLVLWHRLSCYLQCWYPWNFGISPSHSAYDPAPCWCSWKSSGRWYKYLGSREMWIESQASGFSHGNCGHLKNEPMCQRFCLCVCVSLSFLRSCLSEK